MDLCAGIERDVEPNEFGTMAKVIPGGRCAVIRHVGSDDNLGDALKFLYTKWLPQSGEELRDFPLGGAGTRGGHRCLSAAEVSTLRRPLAGCRKVA
jgi:DNA gyrase inhibitor GyrI